MVVLPFLQALIVVLSLALGPWLLVLGVPCWCYCCCFWSAPALMCLSFTFAWRALFVSLFSDLRITCGKTSFSPVLTGVSTFFSSKTRLIQINQMNPVSSSGSIVLCLFMCPSYKST